ncbi:hypothetical protein PIB30_106283, partial [Stylosanthes scabra]|nr:hypothetical protein [Stylosanthes scabra]
HVVSESWPAHVCTELKHGARDGEAGRIECALTSLRWLGMKSRLGSLVVQRGWSRLGLVRNQAPNVTCDTNMNIGSHLGHVTFGNLVVTFRSLHGHV